MLLSGINSERFYIRKGLVNNLIAYGELMTSELCFSNTVIMAEFSAKLKNADNCVITYTLYFMRNKQVTHSKTMKICDADLFIHKIIVHEDLVPMQGGLVTVLRNSDGDFSNKGVTSRKKSLFLVGMGEFRYTTPSCLSDCLLPVVHKEYIYAVPLLLYQKGVWTMSGGNFIYSSDSRYCAFHKYPMSVHDRVE